MLTTLRPGTPIIDDADGSRWAVAFCIRGEALCVNMDDPARWRVYHRESVMLARFGVAYAVDTEADRQRIIASWHRPCGRVGACAACVPKTNSSLLEQPTPRRPMPSAVARHASEAQ
jgi:hypothetical protein